MNKKTHHITKYIAILFGKSKHQIIVQECQQEICEFSNYRKVASSNTSCLEAHAGFFRLLMKGIFDPNAL